MNPFVYTSEGFMKEFYSEQSSYSAMFDIAESAPHTQSAPSKSEISENESFHNIWNIPEILGIPFDFRFRTSNISS
jgi:hypothetical protein